jgi:hypothetical protein
MAPIKGSCLCGGVSFEISGWVSPVQACHAVRCRKATGAAFAPEMVAAQEGFSWTGGQDLIAEYEAPLLDSPPPYRRAFCRRCGSPLPIQFEGAPLMLLHAGVLDSDPGTRLFRHAFVAQQACWHEIADDLPRFAGQPPPPSDEELAAPPG